MSLTQFNYEMKIIGNLTDAPVVDGSLTTQDFKDKFDEGGKAIKEYLNKELVPNVAERPAVSGLLKSNDMGEFLRAESGVDYQPPLGEKSVTKSMLAEDISYAAPSSAVTVTLSGWADNQVTVNVSGVTPDNHIIITPAPESYVSYAECMVRCTAQGAGTLTFRCEDVPGAEIKANVLIVG